MHIEGRKSFAISADDDGDDDVIEGITLVFAPLPPCRVLLSLSAAFSRNT